MNNENRSADDPAERDLATLFRHTARLMQRAWHYPGPLHPAQGRILAIIAERGSMSRKDLLELIELRSGSLSELLGKLERSGCITRRQNLEDKREFTLSVTDQGMALAAELRDWRARSAGDLFSALSGEEQSQLAGLLGKLSAAWADSGCPHEGHGCHHHGPRSRHGGRDRHGREHSHGPEHGGRHGHRPFDESDDAERRPGRGRGRRG